jgi:membrane protein CcdC involved in cytochrome C biogenesis
MGFMICTQLKIKISETTLFAGLPIFLLMFAFGVPMKYFKADISNQIEFWQHLPRRFILYAYAKVIPWNLARFLTYCHERRLLQQIGGRYRFIHRELLDHFAAMEE